MIPLTMTAFSILGFSIGLSEETIIFVPIGVLIARTLGYDALTGAAVVILEPEADLWVVCLIRLLLVLRKSS